ncbi:MAG: hypothetical protein LBF40_07375 [Deltaproteobacteria bacterium]|jgi:hypothetical protein|nr:hypothetical protein [Deltaproteobacteria bacterium]
MRPPNPEIIKELSQITEEVMGSDLCLYEILLYSHQNKRVGPLLKKAKMLSDLGFHQEFMQMVADVVPYMQHKIEEMIELTEISKEISKPNPKATKTLKKNKTTILGYPALFNTLFKMVEYLSELPEVWVEVELAMEERERTTQEICDKDSETSEQKSPEPDSYLSEQAMLTTSEEIGSPISKKEWDRLVNPIKIALTGIRWT